MNKELFTLIVRQAHQLTREYLTRFPKYDYKAQYAIFFRLIHEVYKAKEVSFVKEELTSAPTKKTTIVKKEGTKKVKKVKSLPYKKNVTPTKLIKEIGAIIRDRDNVRISLEVTNYGEDESIDLSACVWYENSWGEELLETIDIVSLELYEVDINKEVIEVTENKLLKDCITIGKQIKEAFQERYRMDVDEDGEDIEVKLNTEIIIKKEIVYP